MSHIIHRQLAATMPIAVSGQGLTITDKEGRSYLDASGGAAVSSLGHGHPEVVAAMVRQCEQLAYAHTSFFSTEAAEELATLLGKSAPGGDSQVWFTCGGSEAMEAALKFTRQYFVECGQPQRSLFIARGQSYHGNTLGALAVGGNAFRRRPFGPLLQEVVRVSPCYEYRGRVPGQPREKYTAMLLRELEARILECGPEKVLAFVAEPVVGATSGAVPPTPGYFRGVRALCDKYGIFFIADEIMCGMGRCGTLHAIEQDNVVPDIVTVAKGLGGGYQPIGAMLVRAHLVEALRHRSGAFQHGHTYTGHPVAAAAALAVQKVIARDGLLSKVCERGDALRRMLRAAFMDHPHVGDIRGRGLLMGLEFVQERDSKRPFPPGRKLHAALKAEAMTRGLLVYPMGGTIDGEQGDHVLLAPPFTASEAELGEIVDRLSDAVAALFT